MAEKVHTESNIALPHAAFQMPMYACAKFLSIQQSAINDRQYC